MLLKMKRTQKTALGTMRMGVPYNFDMTKQAQKKVADDLIKRGMAEKVTKAALDRALEDEAAKQAAALADAAEGKPLPSAVGERLAAKAAEEAEALAKAAAEAKAAEEAEALAKAAAEAKGTGGKADAIDTKPEKKAAAK